MSLATWRVGLGIFEEEQERTCNVPFNVNVESYDAEIVRLKLNQTSIQGIASLSVYLYIRDSADNEYTLNVDLANTEDEVAVTSPPVKLIEAMDVTGLGDGITAVKGSIISNLITVELVSGGSTVLTIQMDCKYWANVVIGDLSFTESLSATAGEEKTDVLREWDIDFDADMDFRLEWIVDSGSVDDWDILEILLEAEEAGTVIASWTINLKTQTSPSSYMTIPETADKLRMKIHYKASISTSIVLSLYLKFKIPPT